VDTRTSSLVVQTTEREYATVDDILLKLDTPTRQVLIEAKMLETAMNPKSVKGVDWSGTLSKQNVSFGNGITAGKTVTTAPGVNGGNTTLPSGRPVSGGSPDSSSVTTLETVLGAGGLSADTARGFYPSTAFLNADGLKVALSFLNSESDTEVVATPSAVTLDNELARLSFSKLYPIFKITPGSANSPAGSDVTYTNLGTVLEVTPRIAADDQISLKVSPEVSNIDSVDRKVINNSVNEANIYAVRKMDTHVLIPSGNTMVMGGLVNDTKTKIQNKVPILGDLPILGAAFRYSDKGQNKVNLIIFITPTIVQDSDFQPTESKLLKTSWKKTEKEHFEDKPLSSWDSAEPKDWSKKKGKEAPTTTE
jgi:type II secretory pathway component GspD/PulD (secretin)